MPGKAQPPEIKKFLDKRVQAKLNGKRIITGVLRGFDPFLNIVLEDCVEERPNNEQKDIGMVVVRGNSINMIECLDRI
eukprot:CFRG5136T1